MQDDVDSKGFTRSPSVHGLTRLSSQGEYVVVDREASRVLRSPTLRRIEKAQARDGLFYELYHSTKSKVKSVLSRPPQSAGTAAKVSDTNPYNTSDWHDKRSDREHYIQAKHVALEVCEDMAYRYCSC